MSLLNYGDKVGIVACSNGLNESSRIKVEELEATLSSLGLKSVFSEKIYRKISAFNGTGERTSRDFNEVF